MPLRNAARSNRSIALFFAAILLAPLAALGIPISQAVADNRLVVVAGDFQDEVGCASDWHSACAQTQLLPTSTDGIYAGDFTIPAGAWEYKVTLDGGWDESYGLDGGDDNIQLRLQADTDIRFILDLNLGLTGIEVIDLTGDYDDATDAALVSEPVRQAGGNEQFYFVLTDRFANGDSSNDVGDNDPAAGRSVHGFDPTSAQYYHGGDLRGLIDNLAYIEGLGTTAIWLTPSFKNQPVQGVGEPGESAGYHGYWITDFMQIDPHLGTNAELEELIAAAHSRGMKVYFDIITNHTADVIQYEEGSNSYITKSAQPYRDADGNVFDPADLAGTGNFPELDPATSFPYTPVIPEGLEDAKNPAWLNDVTLYHNRGDSTWEGESVTYGDFYGLDDLMTEHPDVVDGFIDVYKFWIDQGIDGFRIDTVKHVNFEFWEEWTESILDYAHAQGKDDFFMFGEVYDADARLLAPYVRNTDMNSVLDFAFQSSAVQFARGNTTLGLSGLFAADDYYTTPTKSADALPTFLGNHDMGRVAAFLEGTGNERDRSALAHSLMYLTRGQPVVYYGDEQGIIGSTSPDTASRQSLFASQVPSYQEAWTLHGYQMGSQDRFHTDVALYEHIADVAELRAGSDALTSGAQIELHATQGAGIYAFARVDRDEKIEHLVALNNSADEQSATFTTLTPGATYTTEWGTHNTVTADANGEITVTVPGLDAVVLVADAQVAAPTTPEPISLSPDQGGNVSGLTPISADVPDDFWAETSFAYRVLGTDTWTPLGTAEGDSPRVFHEAIGYPQGTLLEYRAVHVDAEGNRTAASTVGSVGQSLDLSVPEEGPGADFVTVPGNHNAAMGCTGDWMPACEDAALQLGSDGLYSATFDFAAGTYEYKVAIGGAWDVNYGAGGVLDGSNVVYTHAGGPITFWYNPVTHHFINSAQSPIVTLPGSFQESVGCEGNWQPECMATWMGLPNSNGIYTYSTTRIPAGAHEVKVAHGRSWDENYGPGGVLNSPDNYEFSVSGDMVVVFRYDINTNILTITEEEIPVEGEGVLAAYWIDETTIAWPTTLGQNTGSEEWELFYSADGGLQRVGDSVENSDGTVTLTPIPGGLTIPQRDKFRHLSNHTALRLEGATRAQIEEILQGEFQVLQTLGGVPAAFTGLQIPGVLDDLYAADAADRDLGVSWDNGIPTVALWAPTATNVDLVLWGDEYGQGTSIDIPMIRQSDGAWTVVGDAAWKNRAYKFKVDVFVPSEGGVVTNEVTDPYSVGLAIDSTHSVMIDLEDPEWAPSEWTDTPGPQVRWVDQTIYETHVRDFSISDQTVPAELRGTYKAFTVDSDGTRHLRSLAEAGMTTIHLLPTFDIATIPEDRDNQSVINVPNAAPDSAEQQAAVAAGRANDGFNWGYDPWHYNTPEGSYATEGNQHGGDRVREYREMVGAIHGMGMQVIVDKVYNHTSASGQTEKSVLDRVVPGYYHRLNNVGQVEMSTCCDNIATEHDMAEKLMVDSVVTWAVDYKIDGFRFDLMGHHTRDNMLAIRDALDELTVQEHGVDGAGIYLYGEGWNFGEVANNARFYQATQGQLGGTGIGTFSDRLRDAVRGGSAFGENKRWPQGFGSGLGTAPNEVAEGSQADQLANLAHQTDLVRLGLAGNLRSFEFVTSDGQNRRGDQLDYNGQAAGYADSPEEVVTYVDKHDNETLFDILTFKLPVDTSMDDRVRMNHLSMATGALSQTPWFMHAGSDLLRSKSLDRNSYDSGDHFNRVDWSKQDNNFGVGLPPAWDNEAVWPQMQPLLANSALKPTAAHIEHSSELVNQLIELRFSSDLLRLGSADLINEKITFPESGANATPGLITMFIDDTLGIDADPERDSALVVFNASPNEIVEVLPALIGRDLVLSEIQQGGVDEIVKGTEWDAETGTLIIPARSVAVLFEAADIAEAELEVAPETVEAGQEVTVTGSGFVPGETVAVTLDDSTLLGEVTANADGEFSEGLLVPAATEAGEYTVTATGTDSGRTATADLEVTTPVVVDPEPEITVSPESVEPGDVITVAGTGFESGETVTVTLGDVTLGTATAGDEGSFSAEFTVPVATSAGAHTVTAVGGDSDLSATAELEVTEPTVTPPVPVVTVSPESVEAGGVITVQGAGFEPGHVVTVVLGNGTVLGTATVADSGQFSEAFTVPVETEPGAYVLTVVGPDGEVLASADLAVTEVSGTTPGGPDNGDGDGAGNGGTGDGDTDGMPITGGSLLPLVLALILIAGGVSIAATRPWVTSEE